ncbi:hypothetical protein ICM05_03260 [Leucobacter sp. cx-42]|uniref:hypothetical protein n=1 Tax=unclassified Leucobacter TaxID=2621730 RepID=UPI00165EAA29|nr:MULTISPECIES: hypothetical protein [unclassified Leucobacter]MBC9953671.1 hypothetical protein [Leucobacter sp. cx-42]
MSTVTMGWVGLLFAVGAAVFACNNLAQTLRQLALGQVHASIPLPFDEIEQMGQKWGDQVDYLANGYADVGVTHVSADLIGLFRTAALIEYPVTILLALLAIVAILLLFVGKLRWNVLAGLTVSGGLLLAAGSLLAGKAQKFAAESLSIDLYARSGDWLEPGFLSGLNAVPVFVGIGIAVIGWSMRTSGRFASEADGVV